MPVTVTAEQRKLANELRQELSVIVDKLTKLSCEVDAASDASNDPEPYGIAMACRNAFEAYGWLKRFE